MTAQSIGIVGRRRTGKDTAANYLVEHHGYVRVGFADALKRAALALDPIVGLGLEGNPLYLAHLVLVYGWEHVKDVWPESRRLLQRLGDDAGRQFHGEDTWVNQAMAEITSHRLCGRPVVVPDVRYANEVNALREVGFTVVRLNRSNVNILQGIDDHPSESETDSLQVDADIFNHGTPQDLNTAVRTHLAV